jgi:translation initiation factor IF-2
MRLFSSSLSAFAFAVLWPVALLAIAVFCAWLERRTLLPPPPPPAAGGGRRAPAPRPGKQGRAPAAVAPSAASAPAASAPAAPPPAPAAEQPAEPRPAGARLKYSVTSAPVPPLPPPPPDAQSFKGPGEVLGKYPPLGSSRVQRVPGGAPGKAAERPRQQRRP